MSILVTGGAGFIGSHTVVELLEENEDIIIVDNFINSKPDVLDKIKEITKKDFKFYEVDMLNEEKMEEIFKENNIEAVIHFAGLKAVGEFHSRFGIDRSNGWETYYNSKGIQVPRVTEILSRMIHNDSLMYWANSLGFKGLKYRDELNRAANIGTVAHSAIENFLKKKSYF